MKRRFQLAIAVTTLSLLTGCLQGKIPYRPSGVPLNGVRYGAAGEDGFVCPFGYNVIPDYDSNLDGTEFWELCYHETDKTKIRVTGSTVNSASICIYPVEVVDSENVFVKPDLATGGLLKKCVSATRNDGFYSKTYYDFVDKEVSFAGTNFNAVFIIESRDQAQMESCLNSEFGPNIYNCPDYSWGQFR